MRTISLIGFLTVLADGTSAQTGPQIVAPSADSVIVPVSNDQNALAGFRRLQGRLGAIGQLTIKQDESDGSVALQALIDAHSAQAAPRGTVIAAAQVEKSSDELKNRILAERPESSSALSWFRDTLKRDELPVLSTSSSWSAAASGEFTASVAPTRPTVNGGAGLKVERARAFGLDFSWSKLQLLPNPARLDKAAAESQTFKAFNEQYLQTLVKLAAVMNHPTSESARTAAVDQAKLTYDKFVQDWSFYETDPDARALAVRALDGIARQSELKAVYGVKSSFVPDSYRSIYLQSTRSVVINNDKNEPICSGMAVTAEWILTAGHCFMGRDWPTMSVSFSTGNGALSAPLTIRDAWPDPARGSQPSHDIDYAFIRIEPTQAIRDALNAMEQELAASGSKTLCLRQSPGRYEEPVLAIAHAGKNKLVYDHAYIWYPFQLYPSDLKRVTAMTGIRLQRLSEAFYPGDKSGQTQFFDENLKAFKTAYAKQVGTGAAQRSIYYAQPREASVDRPMFGFDTDTQHGNSGAPVFSRMDGCLLGVFGGGRPDGVVISDASWREHEFGTPITLILDEVRTAANAIPVSASDENSAKRRELGVALSLATVP